MSHDSIGSCCAKIRAHDYLGFIALHAYSGMPPLYPTTYGRYVQNPWCQGTEIGYGQYIYPRYLKWVDRVEWHFETREWVGGDLIITELAQQVDYAWNQWTNERSDDFKMYRNGVESDDFSVPGYESGVFIPEVDLTPGFEILPTEVILDNETTYHDRWVTPLPDGCSITVNKYRTLTVPYSLSNFRADCSALYNPSDGRYSLDNLLTFLTQPNFIAAYLLVRYKNDSTIEEIPNGWILIPIPETNIVDYNFQSLPEGDNGRIMYRLSEVVTTFGKDPLPPDPAGPISWMATYRGDVIEPQWVYGLMGGYLEFEGTKLLVPITTDPVWGVLANTDYAHRVYDYAFCAAPGAPTCSTFNTGPGGAGLAAYVGMECSDEGSESVSSTAC
jgi:hypothetical protein